MPYPPPRFFSSRGLSHVGGILVWRGGSPGGCSGSRPATSPGGRVYVRRWGGAVRWMGGERTAGTAPARHDPVSRGQTNQVQTGAVAAGNEEGTYSGEVVERATCRQIPGERQWLPRWLGGSWLHTGLRMRPIG